LHNAILKTHLLKAHLCCSLSGHCLYVDIVSVWKSLGLDCRFFHIWRFISRNQYRPIGGFTV